MTAFSVIVPTYNRAHLLPRCLESLLKQSHEDFEVVVADDGSTDATADVVRQFGTRDPRIRYIRQPNSGAGAARNLGARCSRGHCITFLDSDDEAHPGWLRTIAKVFLEHGCEVVCCGIEYVNESGEIIRSRRPAGIGAGESMLRGLYRSGTFAVRRDVFNTAGGYTAGLPANQHSELRYRLELESRRRGWSAVCLTDILVRAHEHKGPKLRGNTQAVFESACYVLQHHGALMRETPETYSSWATACGGAAARLGRYRDARHWFLAALRTNPTDLWSYARCVISSLPVARTYVWPKVGCKDFPGIE